MIENASNQGSSIFDFIAGGKNIKNIVIPFVEVIGEGEYTRENKYSGLSVKAAFQREGEEVYLQMLFNNANTITTMGVPPFLLRTSR